MTQDLLEQLIVIQLLQKFLAFLPVKEVSCHKSPPLGLSLRHLNQIHTFTPYVYKIRFNIILQCTPMFPKQSLPPSYSNENYLRMSHFSIRATCVVNRIFPYMITLKLLDEGYKLLSTPLLFHFLQINTYHLILLILVLLFRVVLP